MERHRALAAELAAAEPAHIVGRLKTWVTETALPLWASLGFDRHHGGFHERLKSDGTPDLAADKRVRVQARQIYVYSQAAVLGWFPYGRQVALEALEFMVSRGRSPDGRPGFVHLLRPDGGVADPLRDTYDHAFLLLALAWLHRASGDAQVAALIEETLAFVDEDLTTPDGSLLEGIPESLPRRQNPHMHMFEAMLALHEAVAHPESFKRAAQLRALMEERFFDPETCTVGEYFTDGWRRVPGAEGDSVEPGHLAEWTWLLRQHERLTGVAPAALPTRLLEAALRWADEKTGFLIDEADRRGPVRRDSRRAWPQTELAKAWMGEAEAGIAGAAEKARTTLAMLATHYLDNPFEGGWTDQFDADGRPLTADVPASTFYHVFCAIAEGHRVLARSTRP